MRSYLGGQIRDAAGAWQIQAASSPPERAAKHVARRAGTKFNAGVKLVSWNVNGVRAAYAKGLADYLRTAQADVICLQEAKAHPGDVQHLAWPAGYEVFWNPAVKKGYSGTIVFTRRAPLAVTLGLGLRSHDAEGRVITVEYPEFFLLNVYQPNSQRGLTRLAYRTEEWDPAFRRYVRRLEEKARRLLRRPQRGAPRNRPHESRPEPPQCRLYHRGAG